jgi:hypothetical protein
VSCSLVEVDGGSPPAAVQAIVDYSADWNGRNGVTGGLIWTPRYFTQVIEGNQTTVQLLYDRILRDTRHEKVELIDACDVPERAFADWSLAYSGGTSYVQERLARLHAAAPAGADLHDVDALRRLIHELVSVGGISH